ncbi:MAG: response regulator [Bacteroidetes bacterium]|nr:response regulator [Bacteroidota bacterium]
MPSIISRSLITGKAPMITPVVDSEKINLSWQDKILLIAENVQSNYQLLETPVTKNSYKYYVGKNEQNDIEMTQKAKGIDLILMDIKILVLNGFEATEESKQTHKDLSIISVTAFALEGDKESILNADCGNYISKSIKSKDLYAKMALYLNKD